MGWQDRQYDRGTGGAFGNDRVSEKWSVVTWLLVINCAVFLIDIVLTSGTRIPQWLSPYYLGRFTVDEAFYKVQLWRVLTYQFLHADILHILFNMIGLFFFGRLMEQWWGSKRFLAFYLICGVGGVLPFALLSMFAPGLIYTSAEAEAALFQGIDYGRYVGLVGASGAVYGILIGCAAKFPQMQVRLLFPPIPMKMRTMAFVFLGLAFLSVVAGTPNAGGEAAHLGGAALGLLLISKPSLLNVFDRLSARAVQDGYNKGKFERKVKRERADRAEIDRILAKVSEQGLQSLTKKEQKLLKQDTERLRGH
jgi:membrane associated rhomboid family serine protease